MKEMLDKDIWGHFETGDVLIVDRGFRDSIDKIEEKDFIAKMPSFGDNPNRPLTTEQANSSRFTTKSRFIVEVINGRIKSYFQYFNKIIQNSTVATLFADFKIACALYNATFEPFPDRTTDEMITRMITYLHAPNNLAHLVKNENLNNQRSLFKPLEDAVVELFPNLNIDELLLYACGSYQVKMAKNYYGDHIDENGDIHCEVVVEGYLNYRQYNINIDTNDSILLKARIRSRHSNAVKYFVYILIHKEYTDISSIIDHYCSCKVRQRVVGCCSHVILLLWYFGHAPHLPNIPLSASPMKDIFPEDADTSDCDTD